jgi:hypothetical protein
MVIRDRQAALTPTLTIWKYYARHDRLSKQDEIVKTESDSYAPGSPPAGLSCLETISAL